MERVKKVSRHLCGGELLTSGRLELPLLPESDALSSAQRAQYERDGYLVVKGLFSADELQRYRDRFDQLCSEEVPSPPSMLTMRDVALAKKLPKGAKLRPELVTKLQDFQDEPVLFEFCKDPKLLRYVSAFCGPSVRSIHSMLINKPPDLGQGTSRHPLHQDMYYFPLRPAERIVAAWVAMEPTITRENGCLSVVPGSHRSRLLRHGYPDWAANALYHGIVEDVDMANRVHLDMEIGDCVFFHPLLWHGSGRNESTGSRKAISCHYAGSECDFADAPSSVVLEAFEVKLKVPRGAVPESLLQAAYREAWKAKSRHVLGTEDPKWQQDDSVMDQLQQEVAAWFNASSSQPAQG